MLPQAAITGAVPFGEGVSAHSALTEGVGWLGRTATREEEQVGVAFKPHPPSRF